MQDSGGLKSEFSLSLVSYQGYRVSSARLPVIPLATRSQQVVFAYDQVIRPHDSYRPLGWLPR